VGRFAKFLRDLVVSSPPAQLEMVWPASRLDRPPPVRVPDGYALRTFRSEDARGYVELLRAAGFKDWTEENLGYWLGKVLPDAFFIVTAAGGEAPVATAMGSHNASERHPFGGELGWVATSPAHLGKGLGTAVCASVTARFLKAGYRRIYLKTDDFRLPAIKVYLRLGYVPLLFAPGMEERWRDVFAKLQTPFTPEPWRQG
jgi:mycothiol synthase